MTLRFRGAFPFLLQQASNRILKNRARCHSESRRSKDSPPDQPIALAFSGQIQSLRSFRMTEKDFFCSLLILSPALQHNDLLNRARG